MQKHKHKHKHQHKHKHKNKSSKQHKATSKKGCFIPFEIAFNDEGFYKNKNINDKHNEIIKWNNKDVD